MLFKMLSTYFSPKALKALIFTIIVVKVIGYDQFTKEAAVLVFSHGREPVVINEYLNFVLIYNQGISFGMLKDFSYSNYLFLVLNIIISSGLLLWLYRNNSYTHCFSVGFVIGGAMGNLIDRFSSHRAVIDFIDFHYKNWHYPTFNLADSAIVIGVALIIATPFLEKLRSPKS